MAIIAGNAMGPFLELWGIDTKRLIEATIHIVMDDMVIVDVRYAAGVDEREMGEELKRYALAELEDTPEKVFDDIVRIFNKGD